MPENRLEEGNAAAARFSDRDTGWMGNRCRARSAEAHVKRLSKQLKVE